MRGKADYSISNSSHSRITPAYAGKSIWIRSKLNAFEDHPRLCGEKQPDGKPANQPTGSPPPMRGKGIIAQFASYVNRITPAYAGKR